MQRQYVYHLFWSQVFSKGYSINNFAGFESITNSPYGAVAPRVSCNENICGSSPRAHAGCDIVGEWLWRWIANPLLFERESSNLSDVDFLVLSEAFTRICFSLSDDRSSPLISLSGEFGRFLSWYL